jgi:hypothetical protein
MVSMTHALKPRSEPAPSSQNRAISRLIVAVGAALLLSTPVLHAGKLYKWIDESGQVRYGDRVPPEYAKRRNETLNSQGIVVETKAAQKTKEQLAEERRIAALRGDRSRYSRHHGPHRKNPAEAV